MPRGDGTGPEGLGPMTGRAAGYCAGYSRPGYLNPTVGGRGLARGFRGGRGRGRGRGLRARRFPGAFQGVQTNLVDPEVAKNQEINNLQREKEILKEELEAVENYLKELKKDEE